MDPVKQALLHLVHPVREGDELVPGARLVRVTSDFGMRLYLDTTLGQYVIELRFLAPEVRFAAAGEHLAYGYRRVSTAGEVDQRYGQRLCQQIAARVKAREGEFVARVREHEAHLREHPDEDRKLREVQVDELLEKIGAGTQLWALNPYVGCLIGCSYCYAQESVGQVRAALGATPRRWGGYVDVRTNAHEVLARELPLVERLPIKFTPITTDPYQAVEARYEITRKCLEVLRDQRYPAPVLVLSRSSLMRRDVELIAQLERPVAGVSLPSDDEVVLSHFEPRAASAAERLETLRLFREAGVPTTAVIEPVLPCDVERFADRLAAVVRSVRIAPLIGVYGAEAQFADARFLACRSDTWQSEHMASLEAALLTRGVVVWKDEFPPEVKAWQRETRVV